MCLFVCVCACAYVFVSVQMEAMVKGLAHNPMMKLEMAVLKGASTETKMVAQVTFSSSYFLLLTK